MQQSSQQPVDQGNIKGLMLCNRPNEGTTAPQVTRPFVSRVFNHENVGLNPCMDNTQFRKPQKKQNAAMTKHKQLLHKMQVEKREAERDEQERLRRKARATLQRATAAGYKSTTQERQSSCDQQLNSRLSSNSKLSSNYQNYKQSKNELLNFMDETDYNAYIKDGQVQNMLKQLKKKVGTMEKKEKKKKAQPLTAFEQNFSNKIAHQVLQNSNHPLLRGVSQGLF